MNINDYKDYYSDGSFRSKLQNMGKAAGIQVVYAALLLYFMMKDPRVPVKAKITIMAALGYFIFPADAIPDLLPLMGFSDDLGVLIFVLSRIRHHLTDETRCKAKEKLLTWFKQVDESELEELLDRIG
ncbi:MAG: YkvA family protein [Mangrovibacterium sp.]|nr:YkvA family protein [Mangrovibacterium sp.]